MSNIRTCLCIVLYSYFPKHCRWILWKHSLSPFDLWISIIFVWGWSGEMSWRTSIDEYYWQDNHVHRKLLKQNHRAQKNFNCVGCQTIRCWMWLKFDRGTSPEPPTPRWQHLENPVMVVILIVFTRIHHSDDSVKEILWSVHGKSIGIYGLWDCLAELSLQHTVFTLQYCSKGVKIEKSIMLSTKHCLVENHKSTW